jgi:hypothetical protein
MLQIHYIINGKKSPPQREKSQEGNQKFSVKPKNGIDFRRNRVLNK